VGGFFAISSGLYQLPLVRLALMPEMTCLMLKALGWWHTVVSTLCIMRWRAYVVAFLLFYPLVKAD